MEMLNNNGPKNWALMNRGIVFPSAKIAPTLCYLFVK